MIVNYTQDGWQIITQRTHGLLAAQFAYRWKFDKEPVRWIEILLAIAEHDDAEVELEEENLLTEQGGPLNFAMRKYEPEHCRKLSMFSITKSRYIALLTSLHMEFLHKSEAEENEEVKIFLDEQRAFQEKTLQELKLKREDVEPVYSLLEWCDAMSLLLCRKQIQPEHRSIEISQGPKGNSYNLNQLEENKLTLTPWPFKEDNFKVYYESRLIQQLQFKNPEEFRQAFINAPVTETVWEIVKSEVPVKPKKV